MKRTLLFLLLVLSFWGGSGQDLSELKKRLSAESARQKIETYIDISELNIPRDSALIYLEKALVLSKKIKLDSIYPIQFAKCVSYYMKGDFKQAKAEIRKGFNTYKFTDNPKGTLGHINMLLGVLNEAQNEIDSSKFYYEKTIQLLKKDTTKKAVKVLSTTYTNYANIYFKSGAYSKAIPIYLTSAKKSEEIGDYKNQLISLTNVGACFKELKDYKKTLLYYEEALAIAKKTGDKINEGGIFTSLGQVSLLLDKKQAAIDYFLKAKDILEDFGATEILLVVYQNLTTYYLNKEDFKNAEAFSKKAMEGIDNIRDDFTRVPILINKGEIEKNKKQYSKAIQSIESAYLIAKKNNYLHLQKKCILEKMKLYGLLNKHKLQAGLIDTLLAVNDSIFKKDYSEAISESETKYQTEKKEKENLQLKAETTEQALVIERKKRETQLLGGTVAASILGIFTLLFYARGRKRKMQVREQLNIARAKQLEHQKIGDELHNQKTKDLEIVINELESNGNHYAAQKVKMIKEDIRKLSKELSQVPFSEAEFDTQIITLLANYHSKNRKIVQTGLKDIDWKTVEDTIKRNLFIAIREGISNAYNHANAKNVTVAFRKRKKQLTVSISDDGQGFDETAVISGSGFRNMKMCINEINGNIKIESAEHKGTYILIQLAMA